MARIGFKARVRALTDGRRFAGLTDDQVLAEILEMIGTRDRRAERRGAAREAERQRDAWDKAWEGGSMARVVVEHRDGRRISVDESKLDDPDANPYNRARTVVSTDGRNETRDGRTANRPSLREEGFRPVGRILRDGREVGLEGGD